MRKITNSFKDDPACLAQHDRTCQYLVGHLCASYFMYLAFLFRPSIHASLFTGCRDERIWLAGSIECKYLIEPSFWGVHKNPKYYCTKYSQTRCCFTCSELGYIKRRTSGLSNKVQSTTKPTVETTISITTNPATEKVGPVQVQPPGANEYVVSVQPLI